MIHGRRGYQNCYSGIRVATSGILMKLLDFGKLCLIMTLGRKNHKESVTIALLANADREKKDAILIWKSENPRCYVFPCVFDHPPISLLSYVQLTFNNLISQLTQLSRLFSIYKRAQYITFYIIHYCVIQ